MSQSEKEAALNARIAAIRARNEALERRHEEVQADKKQAESTGGRSSFPRRSWGCRSNQSGLRHSQSSSSLHRREQGTSTHRGHRTPHHKGHRQPSVTSPPLSPSPSDKKGRLTKGSSPPPDPSYRFLADRMRESAANGSQNDNNNSKQLKPEKRRGESQNANNKMDQDENRSPPRRKGPGKRGSNHHNQQHSNNGGGGYHGGEEMAGDERNGLILREIRADTMSSPTKYGDSGGKKKPPKRRDGNRTEDDSKEVEAGSPLVPPDQAAVGDEGSSSWGQEYYMSTDWQLPVSWAEEVDNEERHSTSQQLSASNSESWYEAPPMAYVSLPPQYPIQQPAGLVTNYAYPQQHPGVIINGIMKNEGGGSPTHSNHRNSHQRYNSKGSTNYYKNNNKQQQGSRSDNWRSRGEISKIPPRFQKQRPSEAYAHQKHINTTSSLSIPKANSVDPPPGCDRLSVFGIPTIAQHLGEGHHLFGCSRYRVISVPHLEDFKSSLSGIDPDKDLFLLLHVLDNDAQDIARKPQRNDVEKGIESDNLANEFCDIVEAILEKIPYLKIFISTLLPRFDSLESTGLSFPNNVRKVMNVQISSRLRGAHSKVFFLNNDVTLDHLSNEAKMMALYTNNGHVLSDEGFKAMTSSWSKSLKDIAIEEGFILFSLQDEEVENSVPLIKDFKNMGVSDDEKDKVVDHFDNDAPIHNGQSEGEAANIP